MPLPLKMDTLVTVAGAFKLTLNDWPTPSLFVSHDVFRSPSPASPAGCSGRWELAITSRTTGAAITALTAGAAAPARGWPGRNVGTEGAGDADGADSASPGRGECSGSPGRR